jgi:hypothetical protein
VAGSIEEGRRMKLHWPLPLATSLLALALATHAGAVKPAKGPAEGWNPAAAEAYLASRMEWWRQWPKDVRGDTRCVSCHTTLPESLAGAALRRETHGAMSEAEHAQLDDVSKRVWFAKDAEPFYNDQATGPGKTSEAHGVEGVLNALILVQRDREYRGHLSADTRQAFANMWALQMKRGDNTGSFTWLNFKLEPFESPTAPYWGAALAANAIAQAPDNYAASPDIKANVDALRGFLKTGLTGHSLFTRVLVLWGDSQIHGVLDPAQQKALIDEVIAAQGADGGWALKALSDWKRVDQSALPDESDGYATSLIALVLSEAGMPVSATPLQKARHWIATHQDPKTGAVAAKSINKDRKPDTDAYPFMTDDATGFAAMVMAKK